MSRDPPGGRLIGIRPHKLESLAFTCNRGGRAFSTLQICQAEVRSVTLEPMLNVHKVRQPRCFDRFRCTGADCEDTCCAGWGIFVDRATYERYQNPPAHQIAGKDLSSLVEINPARSSSRDYARFRLEEAQ